MTKNVIAGTEYQLLLCCNVSHSLGGEGRIFTEDTFELDITISVFPAPISRLLITSVHFIIDSHHS